MSWHPAADGFAVTATMVSLVALSIRGNIVFMQKQPLQADDYLLAASWLPALVAAVLSSSIDFKYHTPSLQGRFEILYALAMWQVRMALVLLYQRLFPNRKLKLLQRLSFIALAAMYIPLIKHAWPTLAYDRMGTSAGDPIELMIENSLKLVRIPIAACSLVFEMFWVILPLPWILPVKLSLSTSRLRLAVTAGMFVGCVLCAGFRAVYSVSTIYYRDSRDEIAMSGMWEVFANIVALCIPSRPLIPQRAEYPANGIAAQLHTLITELWDSWQAFEEEGSTGVEGEAGAPKRQPHRIYRPWEQDGLQQIVENAGLNPKASSTTATQVVQGQHDEKLQPPLKN